MGRRHLFKRHDIDQLLDLSGCISVSQGSSYVAENS